MKSRAFVRGIRGPVGSAKSSTSLVTLMMHALQQEPVVDGRSNKVRKTRWAIIRNTSPMLKTTTMKTYAEWFPADVWGEPKMAPPPFEHEILQRLGDGTELMAEVLFLALDRPEDVKKLLSLELTLAFINEARETSKTLVDGVTQRLRRFPAIKDGGATFSGLIMDTNPPDEDHWWPIMAGDVPAPEWMSEEDRRRLVKPDDWEFFAQPPAMLEVRGEGNKVIGYEVNPDAENIQNLDPKYYPGQIAGKSTAYINVYLLNRYGSTADGRRVQPDYAIETHKSGEALNAVPGVPIFAGVDFGLTPAAVFGQRIRGRWLILREIVIDNGGAVQLATAMNQVMQMEFPEHRLEAVFGDPSGDNRPQTDSEGETPFKILRSKGLKARPAGSNDPELRRAAGATPLKRMEEGRPAIVFCREHCKVLNAGLGGSWNYKRIPTSDGSQLYQDVPQKNRFSHVCEAYEYLMLGAGEAREHMLSKERQEQERRAQERGPQARLPRDPLARLRRPRAAGGSSRW